MVLATGLAFFMLWFGGLGGLVNLSYGMNAMVHNTSWVTAHFHLIFGGTAVIMYFAVAYAIWPTLTGRTPASLRAQRTARPSPWSLPISAARGLSGPTRSAALLESSP